MNLLFIILDTLLRGVVVVGVYFVGKELVKQAKAGFPMFNPTGRYKEHAVPVSPSECCEHCVFDGVAYIDDNGFQVRQWIHCPAGCDWGNQ